jgi:hypothetical protein
MILPLANMNFVIPGPIIGFIVGLGIVGIGVAKGIRMARAVTVSPGDFFHRMMKRSIVISIIIAAVVMGAIEAYLLLVGHSIPAHGL